METHNVRMIKSEVFPCAQKVCIYGFERCVVYAYGALFRNETLWGKPIKAKFQLKQKFGSWCLDDSPLSMLRGWNARCLAHLTGNSISDVCMHPTFYLIATLKCRRLEWARQELSLHTQQANTPHERGPEPVVSNVFCDMS